MKLFQNTVLKKHDIFAYNGGLFREDEILDKIRISDEVLCTHLINISRYDFSSEVDVNILGHIFENSLTEIEEISNAISTNTELQTVGKRKKDGVFYTPRYITAYIVENTLGKLCTDKKTALAIDESDYIADKKRPKAQTKELSDKLNNYREWLLSLTICDPACGSGAFLNAALDFLMAEHRYIDELTAKLFGSGILFPNIENAILEKNLYGVDINEESVEIAKLALWLRTAKPNRKLNLLNENIKCGNSLISPHSQPLSPHPVLSDTPLQFGEGTGVRTVEVQLPQQLLANARELRKNQTNAEEFLWQILRNRQLNNLKFRRQHPLSTGFILDFYCAEAKLGIELDGGYHNEIEQQEYDKARTEIINEYGINIIRFTNEEVLQDIENIVKKILITAAPPPSPTWRGAGGEDDKAFDWQKEFPHVFEKGGFDVVIGNPPYVDIKQLDNEIVKYIFENFSTAENRINLYSIFIERGYNLLKDNGLLSFINPNSMLMNSSYQKLRKLLIDDLTEIIKLPDNVFEDAAVETIIFIVNKNNNSKNIKALVYQKSDVITFIEKSKIEVIEKSQWKSFNDLTFNIYASHKQIAILNKIIGNNSLLGNIADFSLGITPYDKYRGHSEETIKKREFHSEKQIDSSYKPLISGENITRYQVSKSVKEYIRYGDWLGAPREERFFTEPRIIVRQIVSGIPARIYAGYTDESLYFTQIGFAIIPHSTINPKFLLTLINSKLINYFHTYSFLDLEKELFQKILIANCKCFPIPTIPLEQQQPFIALADKMLSLNSNLQTKRQRFLNRLSDNFNTLKITGALERFDELEFKQFLAELAKQKISLLLKQQDEWEEYFNEFKTECCNLVNEINVTDKEIDGLVYGLYGLTEEEIGIIEK